jgi:hypothetical protein
MARFVPRKLPPKVSRSKVGTYGLVSKFTGYRAREDQTMQALGTLVPPSQNVVMNTAGRASLVKGYVLDGVGSNVADSGILSWFDFNMFKGDVRNMRAGFLTTGGANGKLQYRYVTGTTVNWVDLKTALTTVRMCFTEFWDTTNLIKLLVWVDGSNFFNVWNGAVTTLASVSAPSTSVISTINTTPIAGGSGYAVGSILTLGTGTGGRVRVATLSGSAVATVTLLDVGTGGYPTSTVTTTDTTGSGTGATIAITALQTASTITKQGTNTWAQEGFYQPTATTAQKFVSIGGTNYAYQYGTDTTTLTGVTPDPTSSGYAAGAIIHQSPTQITIAGLPGILSTFGPTVIGTGKSNQMYVGSSTSNNLYISKVNNFTDYTFTMPTRLVGEGNLIPLDAAPTKFIPLENRNDTSTYDMYISEGMDRWAVIRSTLSSDLTAERQEHIRLKVAPLQGAKSERLACKMKNHIAFVGNDNVANFFGYLSYQQIPELVDFSHSVIDDMKGYDLTDASIFYHRNYIYVTVPKAGLIRVFNMTDQTQQQTSSIRGVEDVDADQPWFWESPVTYPISGFYTVLGELYGHSYTSSESYRLFTGGSLNGQQIDASAYFAFDDKGDRTQNKGSNEIYVEGYIKQNTKLNTSIIGDLNSFQTGQTVVIDGSDNTIVAYGSGGNAIGKNPIGSKPFGGTDTTTSTLPAWFHVIKTYVQVPSYLEQIVFATKGVDLDWQLLTFGTNATMTAEGDNDIRQ